MVTKENFLIALATVKEYIEQIEAQEAATKTPIAEWVKENESEWEFQDAVWTRMYNKLCHIDIFDPNKIVPRYIEDIKKNHLMSLKGFGHMQWEYFLKFVKNIYSCMKYKYSFFLSS